jgi:hypothetical protein
MQGNHSDDCLSFLTILDNVLTVGGSAGAKRELAGLSLNQEASQKELEGVRKMAWRRRLPRRSDGSKSAAQNTLTSTGPRLKKAKNKHASIYNFYIFIFIFSRN